MMKNIITIFLSIVALQLKAQDTLSLQDILMHINMHSQHLQMYDAQIKSEQEAAKGAFSWTPPEVGGGLWMVPYRTKLIKGENGMTGMGQYMLSAQQTLPNKKRQAAEFEYMNAMSGVTQERKEVMQNDLYAEAKKNFY